MDTDFSDGLTIAVNAALDMQNKGADFALVMGTDSKVADEDIPAGLRAYTAFGAVGIRRLSGRRLKGLVLYCCTAQERGRVSARLMSRGVLVEVHPLTEPGLSAA